MSARAETKTTPAVPATRHGLPTSLVLRPLSTAAKRRIFGTFDYELDPTDRNPERIKVLGGWWRRCDAQHFEAACRWKPRATS